MHFRYIAPLIFHNGKTLLRVIFNLFRNTNFLIIALCCITSSIFAGNNDITTEENTEVNAQQEYVQAATIIQRHWRNHLYKNIVDILDSMVEEKSNVIISLEELKYGDVFMRINIKADSPLWSHSSLHMFKAVEDNMIVLSTLELRAQDEPLPIGVNHVMNWNEDYPSVGKNIYPNILDMDIRRDARKWFERGLIYKLNANISFEKLKQSAVIEASRLQNQMPLYGEFYNCNTFTFKILKNNGF